MWGLATPLLIALAAIIVPLLIFKRQSHHVTPKVMIRHIHRTEYCRDPQPILDSENILPQMPTLSCTEREWIASILDQLQHHNNEHTVVRRLAVNSRAVILRLLAHLDALHATYSPIKSRDIEESHDSCDDYHTTIIGSGGVSGYDDCNLIVLRRRQSAPVNSYKRPPSAPLFDLMSAEAEGGEEAMCAPTVKQSRLTVHGDFY
jgi:hypothetical protein